MTDDRVVAGVRSTTFTAIFRENSPEVVEDAVVKDGLEREGGCEDINERAHLTIRLFVGPCSPRNSVSSIEMKEEKEA